MELHGCEKFFSELFGGLKEMSYICRQNNRKQSMATTTTSPSDILSPYVGMIDQMDLSVKKAVVTYIITAIKKEEREEQSKRDYLEQKMSELTISPDIDQLVDHLHLSSEELQDERTKHILGL